MNLQKKLAQWEEARLIENSQREAIMAYENANSKPKALFILSALGIFCIGLGFISMIAANWQEISAGAKLTLDFLLLILVAAGIYRQRHNPKVWVFEGLIIGYALLILGSIGLIGQIFQLQPTGYRAYFLWALLILPTMLFAKRAALPLVWIPVFMAAGLDLLSDFEWFDRFCQALERTFPYAPQVVLLTVIAAFLSLLCTESRCPAWCKAWKLWLIVGTVFLVLCFDCAGAPFGIGEVYYQNINITTVTIIGQILLLGLLGWQRQRTQQSPAPVLIFATLFAFCLALGLVNSNLGEDLLGFALTMSVLGELLYYAFKNGCGRLINLFSGLMAVRLFAVYLQVFGSLLDTGIGLIISGFVLLGLLAGWDKLKNRLEKAKC